MVHKTNCVLGSFSIHDCDAIQNITLTCGFSISLSLSNAGNFLKFNSWGPRPSSSFLIYVNHKFHVQLWQRKEPK